MDKKNLYDSVMIELKIPFLNRVHKQNLQEDMVALLKTAIFDKSKHKELFNRYGIKIVHLGNPANRKVLYVDGEMVKI